MNTALIFAGGTGTRMNSRTKPKQFLDLHGKAIIIHTIEYFEHNSDIDAICVVCIEGWIDYLKKLIKKEDFKKIKWIVPGGNSGQESIYNGLKAIHDDEQTDDDTVVLIHDGVRPLINDKLITDNIECVRKNGSAITVSPAIETIIKTDENHMITETVERQKCCLGRAPQGFFLKDIYECHLKANAMDKHDFVDSSSMMIFFGHKLYTVEGPAENIKITTPSDYYVFKSIMEEREARQIMGF